MHPSGLPPELLIRPALPTEHHAVEVSRLEKTMEPGIPRMGARPSRGRLPKKAH